eukprot:Tbor_TRINITY_DN6024_c1_g1::TRINITY_DN6024_c1_g1_i2::g.10412::m.10412
MPPKKTDEPVKKKAEPPKILCGCGMNVYRPPPKKKKSKKPVVYPTHAPDCTYQRTTCNRYPHLPMCAGCEVGCSYCAGTNQWCPHCIDYKCQFMFRRDVLAVGVRKVVLAPMPDRASVVIGQGGAATAIAAAAGTKK